MNVIRRIISYIKNIFNKQEEVKRLGEPENIIAKENQRAKFIETLKVNIIEKRKNKKIETLICEGDGLGIQKKITY